ncbi:transglutaminase-like domain-containing protein [Roseibacillus ishigakijimensis]|uniref:transglutaminase-like domain-containing protein n=1 Tax=Roseibacillus ishigakijimensis TaxID=454146 RepID=UPI0019085EF4|nr:transglutaminase-like domain-containing protein [Roseibacillus ishigakijimensis]
MSLLLSAMCWGSYYDGSAENEREHVYGYLDQIESEEEELFTQIEGDHAVYVARRMGYIDRDALDAASFCEHILTAQRVRGRFYREKPLDEAQFKRYLLPLRIKHEYTRKNWLPSLSKKFVPLTEQAKSADEAAEAIFTWVKKNLSLKPQKEFYLMTTAGDLDVFRVLEEKSVHEIDLTIFTVSALRSVGVMARIVWAPILRGERGGKLWLEYWSEEGEWVPWMPSIGKVKQSQEDLLGILEGKAGLIFVHQDSPKNVTDSYLPVCKVSFLFDDERIRSQVFLLGSQGLIAVSGHQTRGIARGKSVTIARGGEIYLAVSKEDVAYFLTKVVLKPDEAHLEVSLENGKPVIRRESDNEKLKR